MTISRPVTAIALREQKSLPKVDLVKVIMNETGKEKSEPSDSTNRTEAEDFLQRNEPTAGV